MRGTAGSGGATTTAHEMHATGVTRTARCSRGRRAPPVAAAAGWTVRRAGSPRGGWRSASGCAFKPPPTASATSRPCPLLPPSPMLRGSNLADGRPSLCNSCCAWGCTRHPIAASSCPRSRETSKKTNLQAQTLTVRHNTDTSACDNSGAATGKGPATRREIREGAQHVSAGCRHGKDRRGNAAS